MPAAKLGEQSALTVDGVWLPAVFWHQCVVAVDLDTLSSCHGQLQVHGALGSHHTWGEWIACTQCYAWLDACMHGPVAWSHVLTHPTHSPTVSSSSSWKVHPRPAAKPATPPAIQTPLQRPKHPSSNPNTPSATQTGRSASHKSVRVIVGSDWS